MPDYETKAKKELETLIQNMEQANINASEDVKNLYAIYIAKLKALNNATNKQYKKDSFGLDKALSSEKLNEFKVLYEECGKQGEALLFAMETMKGQEEYSVIDKIQNLLSQDMKVLNSVNEKALENGTVSLQKVVDESRVRTVDISGKNLGKVGANMSSRIPFSYVEPDGKVVSGVFTPKNNFDIVKSYDKFVESIKKIDPRFTTALKAYKPVAIKKAAAEMAKQGKDINAYTEGDKLFKGIIELAGCERKKKGIDNFRNLLKKTVPTEGMDLINHLRTVAGQSEFKRFQKEFQKFRNSVSINYSGARISDHSRIDSRNSAMSVVADLLGVPDLICRAVPMKIIKDGEVIEGTFMGMAKGVDIKAPGKSFTNRAYASKGPVFQKSKGLKDIADLQVLDFICANVDRHAGNMFYQFDTSDHNPLNHKFLGVQGIDNDASFGTYVPSRTDKGSGMRLMCLDNMKVISKSMARRVMALDKDMLEFSLREQGLTGEQVKAAGKRLTMLKNYILSSKATYEKLDKGRRKFIDADLNRVYPGTVRIIDDEDFEKLDITRLNCTVNTDTETNTFDMVEGFHELCVMEYAKDPSAKPVEPQKVEGQKLYILGEEELNWASGVIKKLNDATSLNRTSDNFKAVIEAAKKYKKFCETNKGTVLSEDLYELRRQYIEGIKTAANTYIEGKKSVDKPGSYTRHRIETVSAIFTESDAKMKENFYGDMQKNMSPEERARYADGLHAYSDRSLDDFNARMRKMAQEIAKKNKIEIPAENRGENAPQNVL